MRQLLADKVSDTHVGLWLLVPEHLRLGTWDILAGWTRQAPETVHPRLALQLVHEAALCATGLRESRNLTHRGFALLNGLPFLASDQAVHDLLHAHTVEQAQQVQILLGRLRRASGHFPGRALAIDPHHLESHTQRHVRQHRHAPADASVKTLQTFFCLDIDTCQPVAMTIGSSSKTAAQGAFDLLALVMAIFPSPSHPIFLLADKEHFSIELFRFVKERTPFILITPIPDRRAFQRDMRRLPPEAFTARWAGLATAKLPFHFAKAPDIPLTQIVQRCGEKPSEYQFHGFLSTQDCDELQLLVEDYPDRWHIEEFFNAHQALGWKRAGTYNLHIRYGQMTCALLAQTVIHQFRQRLGTPVASWDAPHLARSLFTGLEGDVRVVGDTLLVTYYNAPLSDSLRHHYEHLPSRLAQENVDPRIPWLYNFKLDFRFR
ncbi:MAG: transposase [Candidatus Diapherotrites archaeon]